MIIVFLVTLIIILAILYQLPMIVDNPMGYPTGTTVLCFVTKDPYDGDTITVSPILKDSSFNINPLASLLISEFKVRLAGIDCPEMTATDKKLKSLAIKAKDATTKIIQESNNMVYISNMKLDKYGGRVVADVFTYSGEIKLQDELLRRKLAKPYNGGTKTW